VGHPPIAVAGQFVLDILDEGDEFRVQEFGRFDRAAIVEGEPPRVCRRPSGLSYAAMAGSSSMA
jgi:hypothetical protein